MYLITLSYRDTMQRNATSLDKNLVLPDLSYIAFRPVALHRIRSSKYIMDYGSYKIAIPDIISSRCIMSRCIVSRKRVSGFRVHVCSCFLRYFYENIGSCYQMGENIELLRFL